MAEQLVLNTATLYAGGTPRKSLQAQGQFWTPHWVARAMARYALGGGASRICDPAFGAGALIIAAKELSIHSLNIEGYEIDADVLKLARAEGLNDSDLANVRVQDYLSVPTSRKTQAIVCNPPYIRHHRIPARVKSEVRLSLEHWLGAKLDGRLGLHGYFLLRSLQQLEYGGRLAYITSADLYEGKSSKAMWAAISLRYRIDGIVSFDRQATPFPQLDTNPIICLIAAEKPRSTYRHLRVLVPNGDTLEAAADRLSQTNEDVAGEHLKSEDRNISDFLELGLARPRTVDTSMTIPLGRFIRCIRGIATGSNQFFFLTEEKVRQLKIPPQFLISAVGRTRDVPGAEISKFSMIALAKQGRPTQLLNLRGYHQAQLPPSVQHYLREGERMGIPERPLVMQRERWYWIEKREPAPFLFAYLGRRHVRFIRNYAGVSALTGFLCVYPRSEYASQTSLQILWQCMQSREFLINLDLVAKTYGGGALKVEPRALERTPIPLAHAQPLLDRRKPSSIEVQLLEKALLHS